MFYAQFFFDTSVVISGQGDQLWYKIVVTCLIPVAVTR